MYIPILLLLVFITYLLYIICIIYYGIVRLLYTKVYLSATTTVQVRRTVAAPSWQTSDNANLRNEGVAADTA